MIDKKKLIIFSIILLIGILGITTKEKFLSQEDAYVLTNENFKEEEENLDVDKKSDNENEKDNSITNQKITVYISGAVKNPGVVTLNEGERLGKAVEKLGGTTKKADLNNINLALKLKDEMHYIIPKKGEKIVQETSNSDNNNSSNNDISNEENTTNESTNSSKININTATIEELDKLPGVGEATANKIVNYKNENGDFKSIEEIKNVNGIGDKKFEDMKDLICVN